MQMIFRVAFTLLGIHFLFRGLTYLLPAAVFFDDGGSGATLLVFLQAALAFVFAFVLIVQPAWLARRAGPDAAEYALPSGFEPKTVLRVGIVLIGLFVFATRLESVLHLVSMHLGGTRFGGLGGAPVRILIETVPLALAAFFVARPDAVIDLIARADERGIRGD